VPITERYLPYGITQRYMPGERALL